MENTKRSNEITAPFISHSVEEACQRFEAELCRGGHPAIEQYLEGWEEPERSKLLFELLRLEIQHWHSSGQQPNQASFIGRFPEHREVVEEAFLSTVVADESEQPLELHSKLLRNGFLGQGGLGIVYIARDEELKREIAVKFIHEKLKGDEISQQQFRVEAEITGRLDHPGIVPVYGIGETTDHQLFYAMRMIRGERLEDAIAKHHQAYTNPTSTKSLSHQVKFNELLSHFIAVCKTIAYAHNRGVVHRDIKPANIMLGRFGETIVIDWGLGAHVGRKGIFKEYNEKTLDLSCGTGSSQNSRCGTPPYMSPEQAAGRDEVGPLADIYSLGATLYTILTGRIPFTGSTADVLTRVQRGEFDPPSRIRPALSKAIEAVCLKAMALDPQRRYPTALDLAEDVERYIADAPVSAYDEPTSRRLARWGRRHRAATFSGAIGLALLAVSGSVLALLMGKEANEQSRLREEAVVAKTKAVAAQESEEVLRKHGIQLAATFAARTIANQIDLRWRILEKEAADPALQPLMTKVNANPNDEKALAALQQWVDDRISKHYAGAANIWCIYSLDSTLVARNPSVDKDGQRYKTFGEKFAYRDYFHGKGKDFSPDEMKEARPLLEPHISAVIRRSADQALCVMFSVPIRTSDAEKPLGVMTMGADLGSFADLNMNFPAGQGVLLVESRRYYMLDENKQPDGPRGEGLVLHHQGVANVVRSEATPPHVADDIIRFVKEKATISRTATPAKNAELNNLLPSSYRDPLNSDVSGRWLAAFEPVLVKGRPANLEHTGWFVIVEQREQ